MGGGRKGEQDDIEREKRRYRKRGRQKERERDRERAGGESYERAEADWPVDYSCTTRMPV